MSNDLRIVTVGGIGESAENGLLNRVTVNFPNTEIVNFEWDADYGPVGTSGWHGRSYLRATSKASQELLWEHFLADRPTVYLGFSGGTDVISGAFAGTRYDNIVGIGMVGAPGNPHVLNGSSGIRTHIEGVGRLGEWLDARYDVCWVSHPSDVICSCPADSPLRDFASASEGFSLGDPDFFSRDILKKLTAEKLGQFLFHPFSIPSLRAKYLGAYADACGYLGLNPNNPLQPGPNYHTGYGTMRQPNGKTYLDNLGEWVMRKKYEHDKATA